MDLAEYNNFCQNLVDGTVLYNIDSTNPLGEYLLVIKVLPVSIKDTCAFTVFLMGLKKQEGKYIPTTLQYTLTPSDAKYVPFLKSVGYCTFDLFPTINEIKVNVGLVTVFGSTDLRKFTKKTSNRKPRQVKYKKEKKKFTINIKD